MKAWMAWVIAWFLVGTATATPAELAGVKIEPRVEVAGAPPLALNGAAIQSNGNDKFQVVQVYALKRFSSLDEFLAIPGPKRFVMTYLRDVPGGLPGKRFSRSIEDNLPKGSLSKLVPSLLRLSDAFQATKGLTAGDKMIVDWVPGTGCVITFKGRQLIEPLDSPEVFRAFAAMWIGGAPMDAAVKELLLGKG